LASIWSWHLQINIFKRKHHRHYELGGVEMGKAEAGSTKWLSNKMKAKGLQRLRWYCQPCERQMRDENGFKQHCLSEGHVRQMQLVGENSKKFISDFSENFKRDFLRLLRTAHGEKTVVANHFYQEYISDKEHVHMNSTKWPSLTEFIKYLGREGICRVSEGEKGLELAWVDDSPEALRRREAVLKKDRMEKGDEDRQARMLEAQIKRANEQKDVNDLVSVENTVLDRTSATPVAFSFSTIPAVIPPEKVDNSSEDAQQPSIPLSFSMISGSATTKPVNVFSTKSNTSNVNKPVVESEPKKMSEIERVMLQDKEEQDRKRKRDEERNETKSKRIRL